MKKKLNENSKEGREKKKGKMEGKKIRNEENKTKGRKDN